MHMKHISADTAKRYPLQIYDFSLIIITFLVQLKSLFMDFDTDACYAIATSYRHLQGDRMLQEMWEPHQTSTFLLDALMALFHFIHPESYDGVVLYLQAVSILLYTLVIYIFYRYIKKHVSDHFAMLSALLLLLFRPKQLVLLEYSNMLILFSVLLYVALMQYAEHQQLHSLFCTATLLCLLALSYPSAALLTVVAVIVVLQYSSEKLRDIAILLSICFLTGGFYIGYFCSHLGLQGLGLRLQSILRGESKHVVDATSLGLSTHELFMAIGWIALVSLISLCVTLLLKHIRKTTFTKIQIMLFCTGILMVLSDLVLSVLFDDVNKTWKFCYTVTFLVITVYGTIRTYGPYQANICAWAKTSFKICLMISLGTVIAVLFLTNWALITVSGYFILAVVGAILISDTPQDESRTLESLKISTKTPLIWIYGLLFLVGIHRLWVFTDYSMATTLSYKVNTYVKAGPALGIVASYIRPYQDLCDATDFATYVTAEDTLFIVSGGNLNSLDYMIQPSSIGTYSTISIPTYNESLLDYWTAYPDKLPTVIAIDCWYGELNISEDTWIMQWIIENYHPVGDGSYYRFYRKKE